MKDVDPLPCPRCGGELVREHYGICTLCADLLNARAAIRRGMRYLLYGLANKSLAVKRDGD